MQGDDPERLGIAGIVKKPQSDPVAVLGKTAKMNAAGRTVDSIGQNGKNPVFIKARRRQ